MHAVSVAKQGQLVFLLDHGCKSHFERERKKRWSTVQTPLLRKRRIILYEKSYFFLSLDFLVNEVDNSLSNFTWRKGCFLPIEWCKKWLCFSKMDRRHLGVLQPVAVLSVCVSLVDAYNIGKVCSLHRSIEMGCVLLHVKFGNGSSISVLTNRETSSRNSSLETESF